jgi:MazG family protein
MEDNPTFDDALAMMRDLRARCEWDRAQTHDSLRPYLIEEAHELDDAIRAAVPAPMRDELGDLLLQVLFHSVIAEELGEFRALDVPTALIAKMKKRHPHLYAGGPREPWEKMKSKARASIAEGLPSGLPALHRAHRLQERAAGVGFDWNDTAGPAAKVEEELAEVREHLAAHPSAKRSDGVDASPVFDDAHRALELEIGDLLFAAVNLARRAGVHASVALDRANEKFVSRFEKLEALAKARGIVMGEATLAELDALWDEVKLRE